MQFGEIFIQHLPSKARSTAKVFITSAHSLPTSEYGRLFGVLEINTPNRENEKIVEELIQSLHEYFYTQPTELPTAQKLEDSLKLVNERITEKLNNEPSLLVGSLNQ